MPFLWRHLSRSCSSETTARPQGHLGGNQKIQGHCNLGQTNPFRPQIDSGFQENVHSYPSVKEGAKSTEKRPRYGVFEFFGTRPTQWLISTQVELGAIDEDRAEDEEDDEEEDEEEPPVAVPDRDRLEVGWRPPAAYLCRADERRLLEVREAAFFIFFGET